MKLGGVATFPEKLLSPTICFPGKDKSRRNIQPASRVTTASDGLAGLWPLWAHAQHRRHIEMGAALINVDDGDDDDDDDYCGMAVMAVAK